MRLDCPKKRLRVAEDRRSVEKAALIARDLDEISPVLYLGPSYGLYTDPSIFSDSLYRLNASGRDAHSALLAEAINAELSRGSNPLKRMPVRGEG